MFTKLRNKFLVLNMSITSTVMITAFAIIYFITYSNIYSDIQNKLNAKSEMQLTIEGAELPKDKEKGKTSMTAENFSLDGPLSFTIEVDEKGKIINIHSFLDFSDHTYSQAAKMAWSHKKGNNTIKLESKQWRYGITRMSKRVIQGNGQQNVVLENKYQIMFLDVTESNKTLHQLLFTLLSVGLFMLVVIFMISLYFANRAIQPIADTWEKQKQFVADASHELKTPLSIINANYDALMENKDETIKSQLKWLGYIRIGTDRMTKLINDLLSLANMEGRNVETRKIPFNLSETMHDVMSSMEAVAIEKGITISISIEPDIIVKSDLESVKQVVMILFDNAIKYGNETGQIDVSLTKFKRQVKFTIKNSGKGIAKQDLPKIFDRFYRADLSRTRENGGYGLGLSIAKTIIEKLGGEIDVKSSENEWTTFTFTLGL